MRTPNTIRNKASESCELDKQKEEIALKFIPPAQIDRANDLSEKADCSLAAIAQIALALGIRHLEESGCELIGLPATRRDKSLKSNIPDLRLPPQMLTKLHELSAAAGISGGASEFVTHIIEGLIESTAADILIDGWDITDPATIAEIYHVQNGIAEILPFPNCPQRLIKN